MKAYAGKKSCCFLVLTAGFFLSATCAADTITGRVISVTDGDTLSILGIAGQVKIRLAEIDAPEKAQAFGSRSKQSLSDLCYGKDATVETDGTDRYGRTIGIVHCGGIEANAAQVQRGMAWVYDRYAKRKILYQHQADARQNRLGLWSDPSPVPPWEYRRSRR